MLWANPPTDPDGHDWPDDFRLGRIQINDLSGATTAPAEGTVIRFTSAKINTSEDVFRVSTDVLEVSQSAEDLDAITVSPNPFYLHGPYAITIGAPLCFSGELEDRDYVRRSSAQLLERIQGLARQSELRINRPYSTAKPAGLPGKTARDLGI